MTATGSHDRPLQALVLELDRLISDNKRLRSALETIAASGRIALENSTDTFPAAAHLRVVIASAVAAADEGLGL